MPSIWDKIDKQIDDKINKFTRINIDQRTQQVNDSNQQFAGVVVSDPIGLLCQVELDDGTVISGIMGSRAVSAGDPVIVVGGRIL